MTATMRPEAEQGSLFQPSPHNPYFETPTDFTQLPDAPCESALAQDVVAGPVVVVNLEDRARDLILATKKLAKLNQIRGLGDVLETPRGARIHSHYEDDAHHILYISEGLSRRRLREAKEAFARATGMYAMIESGAMTKEEARASTYQDWVRFMAQYADANQPNRLELRAQQQKHIKRIAKTAQH